MKKNERRKFRRLKITKPSKVPVQIHPVIPFIGDAIHANAINISEGGLSLKINSIDELSEVKRGAGVKVHFRIHWVVFLLGNG